MMEIDFRRLDDRLVELRPQRRHVMPGFTPYAIRLLRRLVARAQDDGTRGTLMTILAGEYSWYGMEEEHDRLMVRMTEDFSDEPLPWISLAGHYLAVERNLDQLKAIIETGIDRANTKGYFVRHAYDTRARVAKKLKDYALLEETIRILTRYVPPPASIDIAYEQDFLMNLPSGAIAKDVLDEYKKVISKHRKRPRNA